LTRPAKVAATVLVLVNGKMQSCAFFLNPTRNRVKFSGWEFNEYRVRHPALLSGLDVGGWPNAVNDFFLGKSINLGVEKHQKTNPKSKTNSK
jgi:hypothetical protein